MITQGTIKIKAIDKDSWAGMNRYPKCKDTIAPIQRNGAYSVDLGSDEERRELERRLDLGHMDLSPFSKFWRDFTVHIHDKELILDLNNPMDFITYKVLMASPRVAESDKDEDRVKKPKAEYAIFDEQEKAKRENVKVNLKKKAWKIFNTSSAKQMRDILKLLGVQAHNASTEIVENKLSEIVDSRPEDVINIKEDANFKMKVFLSDCINAKALRRNAGAYFFGDIHLGHDQETTIVFLEDPENQEIYLALKAKLQASD
jgi:hypothetical protein